MALNFPDSPTVGQIFTGYTWDGEKWAPPSTAGMVRYDIAQSFTYLQQAQARANIGDLKKNYIVNGAMMISQENGTTAGTTAGYYPVDQFLVDFVHGGTMSIAQVASATPAGSPNRLRITVTAADAAVAATDYIQLATKIEGLRIGDLLYGGATAKTSILQFGVKAPAGVYCVVFANSAINRTYVSEYTIAAGEANTDVVKSVVVPGDVTGTWLKDTGVGLFIRWGLMAGSNFQQAAGSWGTGNAVGTSNQFNLMGTNGNVFELFDVGLYEGSAAPTFQVPDYALELAACLRYFWKRSAQASGDQLGTAAVYGTGSAFGLTIPYPVIMRIAPVVTFSSQSHFTPTNSAGSAGGAFTAVVIAGVNGNSPNALSFTSMTGSSGLTAGNATVIFFNNASAWIAASARM